MNKLKEVIFTKEDNEFQVIGIYVKRAVTLTELECAKKDIELRDREIVALKQKFADKLEAGDDS